MGVPRPPRLPTHRRVYVVDDHPIMRQACAGMLDASDDLRVVGSATAALAGLPALDPGRRHRRRAGRRPARAHGIDLVGELYRLHPDLRMLVVSGHDEAINAERALSAGARGYLMKHEASRNLLPALRRVHLGEVAVSDRMAARLPSCLCTTIPVC